MKFDDDDKASGETGSPCQSRKQELELLALRKKATNRKSGRNQSGQNVISVAAEADEAETLSAHALDENGNVVLVGLSVDETAEFKQLDHLVSSLRTLDDSWTEAKERRWLELFEKHEAMLNTIKAARTARKQ